MKPTSFAMKTALLATLIISGQTMAQNLPDEINHPQYLKIYQNLEQVVAQKTAEYNSLATQKTEIEKQIAQMEADQRELPARNAELQRLIDAKRQDLSRIATEMTGLEGILSKIIEDLRRIDAMVAQLQKDIQEEGARSQAIQARRAQVAQDVNRISARLQSELAEEQQSRALLNNLLRDLDRDTQKRNENLQERADLTRDVEQYKRQVPAQKSKIAQNNQASATKKAQLAEAQGKLPGVKAQITSEEASLAQANAEIAPKKTKLAELKAELARQMPEVTKLQQENAALNSKIESNKAKINASGLTALKTKRDNLEKELSSVNTQIDNLSNLIVTQKEALKPYLASEEELIVKIRELQRSGANPTELARLKREQEALNKIITPKKQEILRTEKQHETLIASVAPKNQELANVKAQITTIEASVASLVAENEAAADKIAANQKIIDERMAANSGLVKEINDLEAVIKTLEANTDRISRSIAQLKTQESGLNTQIAALTKDIAALDAETAQLTKNVADMEKAIVDYPLNIKRIDLHNGKLEESIQASRLQISREEKLLARIQQDRVVLERDLAAAQNVLNQVNADLAQSNQLIGALQSKLQQEVANRDALTRYNQDSIRKYDSLKAQKADAEKTIASSTQEISVNNQDIATIGTELPKLRTSLASVTPKVAAALKAMQDSEVRADDASAQYQNRLSLYQRYLGEASALGTERANIGTTDGVKAGSAEGRTKATRLATENAAAEAKWEAMLRGYVRGEIAGYDNGFDIGLASSSDATQGDIDGKVAGAKRAKDHANLVLKPEFYLEELERRLQEDEVSNKIKMAKTIIDEISTVASAKMVSAKSDIPELTQSEIDAARRILSSLDALIDQAAVEADAVVALRSRLADARAVYAIPGAGENANNANCTGAYKNVKEFVDACKAAYQAKYQGLYVSAHQSAFISEYGKSFADQIGKTFEAELARLYPGFLKEATQVGKDVGVSAGKKEIYRQSFARAEASSYSVQIGVEEARVELEAVALVEEHLKANAALTLKGEAKLKTDNSYGIAPGVDADLKMLIKNIGSKASTGNSLVKISESTNLVLTTREAAIGAVAAKSQADMLVMKLKVNDAAVPGSKVVLAGEIVHPGNHYRATRSEKFRLEATVAVNPAIESEVDYDVTPKVATLGFTKKHDINFVVRPKHEGVNEGYEVVIEEVGSSYARFTNTKANTERLSRGASKKVTFEYKLDKSAKGKTINLKVTVKNGGAVVKTTDLQIKPE